MVPRYYWDDSNLGEIEKTRKNLIIELRNSRFYLMDLRQPPAHFFEKDLIHFIPCDGTKFFQNFLDKIQ